jgi:hypothetical protein
MFSKLPIGLLALALLFGLSKPANAQGYWGMYGPGCSPPYHPADTIPYFSPYYPLPYYTPYAFASLLGQSGDYPGYPYGWWWWISWR